ncbi:hypothetical protein N7490_007041 [Penicillium lividum]|nr:hypothetical protein N7490_007041 [Penicillium lividum]
MTDVQVGLLLIVIEQGEKIGQECEDSVSREGHTLDPVDPYQEIEEPGKWSQLPSQGAFRGREGRS